MEYLSFNMKNTYEINIPSGRWDSSARLQQLVACVSVYEWTCTAVPPNLPPDTCICPRRAKSPFPHRAWPCTDLRHAAAGVSRFPCNTYCINTDTGSTWWCISCTCIICLRFGMDCGTPCKFVSLCYVDLQAKTSQLFIACYIVVNQENRVTLLLFQLKESEIVT